MLKQILVLVAVITMCFAIAAHAGSGNEEAGAHGQSTQLAGPAAIPGMIGYQGVLTDAGGDPVDTTVSMTFAIYDASSGGSVLWTETHGFVTTSGGYFYVLLGGGTPISESVFAGPDCWLGVTVGGDAEMTPRQQIASSAYAYRAEYADDADLLDGQGASDFAPAGHDHDAQYVNEGQSNSITGSMVIDGSIEEEDLSFALGADNDWTIVGNTIYHAAGNVGIGTTTPAYELDVSGTVSGTNSSSDGMSVYGHASYDNGSIEDSVANYGGYFQADGLWGIGVYGHAPRTVPNTSNFNEQNVNYGGYFLADGLRGIAVYGRATASPSPGNNVNYGGYFQADGAYGVGVYGEATRTDGYGVRGVCDYFNGKGGDFRAEGGNSIGVRGKGSRYGGQFDGTGEFSYGVSAHGDAYGVYGSSNSGIAGYFYSNTGHGLIVKQGSVGIGTESPTNLLELSSTAPKLYFNRENSTSNLSGLYWRSTGDDFEGAFVRNNGSGRIELYTNSSGSNPKMAITDPGLVGIGTVSPSYTLSVIGDIAYTGNIYDVSDIRLKENIAPLTDAVEKISSINSIYFNNKGGPPDRREVGVIAQEVEKVLPEVVSEDAEGYKSVDYAKLTPLLIEAVKEQQVQIEALQAEIAGLKARDKQP